MVYLKPSFFKTLMLKGVKIRTTIEVIRKKEIICQIGKPNWYRYTGVKIPIMLVTNVRSAWKI